MDIEILDQLSFKMETLEKIKPLQKWFFGLRIYIGRIDDKWAKKSKWSKFTFLTHLIRSEFGFRNHRSIINQNGTFRRKKAMKKMVFGRKDLHRTCRPRHGRKSQNG